MKKRHLIIPVFIPHQGCPHQCVFCNQGEITGRRFMPSPNEVVRTIRSYLSTWRWGGIKEVAFYGGSFTGLDIDIQRGLLESAHGFVGMCLIDCIRVSTRPDYITEEGLEFLKGYSVRTVELGVQSMNDEVLRHSGRGHTRRDTITASEMLKRAGFQTVMQIMPGLPGDTVDTILHTVESVIRLSPDSVRIYPTLVVKGTPLEGLYRRGCYRPWPMEAMVDICRRMLERLNSAGIPVIRVGLQETEALKEGVLAGPYHPSFRQIVEGGL